MSPITKWKAVACGMAAGLLAACSQPLPPEKMDYAGQWSAPGMSLLISPDGTVAYKRVEKDVTTSINAPLRKFEGANFVVGIGPLSTTFVVSAVPHPEAGVWTMTVDGMVLTKNGSGGSEPFGTKQSVRF